MSAPRGPRWDSHDDWRDAQESPRSHDPRASHESGGAHATHGALRERAVDAALFGDFPAAEERLAAREVDFDFTREIEEFELLAARIETEVFLGAGETRDAGARVPAALEARLKRLAADTDRAASAQAIPFPAGGRAHADAGATRRSSARTVRDWTVAAASVAFGAACTYAILRGNTDDAGQGSSQTGTTTRARFEPAAFLASHPGAVHWPWNATGDPTAPGAVAGEAYFDPATGEGALVIEGLAPNDPTREQYQLWIFDRTRDERFPVDGGVFDVRAGDGDGGAREIHGGDGRDGEPRAAAPAARIVIPIRAQLPVREPYLFAVTVERPGGAVVSDRRIAIVAKP